MKLKHYEARPARWDGIVQCIAAALIGLLAGLMISGAIMLIAK